MTTVSRQKGGASGPVLVVAFILAIVAGTVYYLGDAGNSLDNTAQAQDSGVKRAPMAALTEPSPQPARETNASAPKLRKGDVVKFRDQNGFVNFRSLEPAHGFIGDGVPATWTVTTKVSPYKVTKSDKSMVRKSVAIDTPPKFTFRKLGGNTNKLNESKDK